jgi:hypothetical protein
VKKRLSKFSFLFPLVLIMLLVASFGLPCAAAQAVVYHPPECWGVFIGIEDFLNFASLTVDYAEVGQTALYNSFASVWGTDHCRLLLSSQATKSAILDAVTWLAGNAHSNDIVLFSVRSYGSLGPGGDYYFYTYNSNLSDYDNDISATELSNAFDAVNAAGSAFILTFPRAGGYQTNLSGSGRVILQSYTARLSF